MLVSPRMKSAHELGLAAKDEIRDLQQCDTVR